MFRFPRRFSARFRACARSSSRSFHCSPCSNAFAHCFVGARFFPATLATDDPCVADEMSLPTVSWSKTGDTRRPANGMFRPNFRNASPRISAFRSATPGRRSASRAGRRWPASTISRPPRNTSSTRTASTNWRCCSALSSIGARPAPPIPASRTPWGSLTPTFYFGKGFGDLPDRPAGCALSR